MGSQMPCHRATSSCCWVLGSLAAAMTHGTSSANVRKINLACHASAATGNVVFSSQLPCPSQPLPWQRPRIWGPGRTPPPTTPTAASHAGRTAAGVLAWAVRSGGTQYSGMCQSPRVFWGVKSMRKGTHTTLTSPAPCPVFESQMLPASTNPTASNRQTFRVTRTTAITAGGQAAAGAAQRA